jgi:prophage regulatory protein
MSERILRRKEVQQLTGLSCSTIYAFMKNNQFPKSLNLGGRMVGWKLSSIENWIEAQCAKANKSMNESV